MRRNQGPNLLIVDGIFTVMSMFITRDKISLVLKLENRSTDGKHTVYYNIDRDQLCGAAIGYLPLQLVVRHEETRQYFIDILSAVLTTADRIHI